MQLFGHPLQLVILDVDGVILDLIAGFEQHLEAGRDSYTAHGADSSLSRGGPPRRAPQLCQSPGGHSGLVASAQPKRPSAVCGELPGY